MDDALALPVSQAGPVGCGSTYHDVLLSFPEGSDAALNSFSSDLRAVLIAAGVSTCGPNERRAVGSSSRLPDAAARHPKVCIPIVSSDCASSQRCLHEIVQMMEGKRSGLQKVLPIFYGVQPSDARYLNNSFQVLCHRDIREVHEALEELSFLHSWVICGDEEEKVKTNVEIVYTIVETVLRRLQPDVEGGPQIPRYDVFLNFRGDTRDGITQILYTSLKDEGLSVFKDDVDLVIGEDFRPQLFSAITHSTLCISVLSENYGASSWCRHELEKMMECRESMGHEVLPIYYDVEPSHVRHIKGRFGDAIHSYETRLATREGRRVLTEDANARGSNDNDARMLLPPLHNNPLENRNPCTPGINAIHGLGLGSEKARPIATGDGYRVLAQVVQLRAWDHYGGRSDAELIKPIIRLALTLLRKCRST